MQVLYVQMLVAANELQQRSWLWIYECECVLGGGAISGSAAKSLTDGLFQGETSASCWQMSCEKRNKLWTQTLERPPFWFPLPPSLCPLLVYSFFHFLLPFQIIKFTACFPGSAAFVLHSCFSFPPSSLPGLLRPTLLTPIFLLSHHIHLYSFHLSLIYNHSPSLPHFPLFLFLIMIITQLFLFLYGSMTRLPSLLPLAASFLHSSTSISFHLFDSPLPVSLLSCSAFSCFSSISCCSSIIIIPVFSSLFFISICLLIFLTSPPPPPHTLFLSNISFSGFSSCFSFSPAFALSLCLPPLGPAVLPEALCWIWGFSAAEAMKEAAFGWKLTEHTRNQQTLLGCWGVENVNMLWLQSHCLSPHVGQTTCAGCPNTFTGLGTAAAAECYHRFLFFFMF